MILQAEENDIVQFLDDIINNFKGLAKKRNIDLQADIKRAEHHYLV